MQLVLKWNGMHFVKYYHENLNSEWWGISYEILRQIYCQPSPANETNELTQVWLYRIHSRIHVLWKRHQETRDKDKTTDEHKDVTLVWKYKLDEDASIIELIGENQCWIIVIIMKWGMLAYVE